MADTDVVYPKKTRELRNMLMDSTRWDGFPFREGDIVIGTWAKSGTTWTQQIVSQLVFSGAENIPVMDVAPWVDMRPIPVQDVYNLVEAQIHRRFVKTHLPADALKMSPKAKYIFLARDGKDVAWSWYNHLRHMSDEMYDMINNTPDRVGPPLERPDGRGSRVLPRLARRRSLRLVVLGAYSIVVGRPPRAQYPSFPLQQSQSGHAQRNPAHG